MNTNTLINKLNKRVEIQEKINKYDNFGGFTEEWKTNKKLWARIEPINIQDKFIANKIEERITHIITIRYNNINTKNRIVYNNRIFLIKGIINNLEKNIFLEIEAEEIV